MKARATNQAKHKRSRSAEQTARGALKVRGVRRLWPTRQQCLVAVSYVLVVALSGAAVYLWQAPLPPLPGAELSGGEQTLTAALDRTASQAALDVCLRQVKIRDLFKPSVPMPSEDRLGKTTAQELADRLQFVGVVGGAGDLAALIFIPNRGPGIFRIGDRVAEFMLKDVKPDRLVLGLGDEEAILKR